MTIAAVTPVDIIPRERQSVQEQGKAPFDRVRMERALKSGAAKRIPHGLSREEMRQFILNANK